MKFTKVQLDPMVETFSNEYYHKYLRENPKYCFCIVSPTNRNRVVAYFFGKAEGRLKNWHSHITAIAVERDFRRRGLAKRLMELFEEQSNRDGAYFADLFVRKSNENAIEMYKSMDYVVWRTITEYYGDGEDAYEMRKALKADVTKESIVPPRKSVIRPAEMR